MLSVDCASEGSRGGQSWRVVIVIQVREVGGFDQGSGRGGDEKQQDFGLILVVELIDFIIDWLWIMRESKE